MQKIVTETVAQGGVRGALRPFHCALAHRYKRKQLI